MAEQTQPAQGRTADALVPVDADASPLVAIERREPVLFTKSLQLKQIPIGLAVALPMVVVIGCSIFLHLTPALIAGGVLVQLFWIYSFNQHLALGPNDRLRRECRDRLREQQPVLESYSIGFVGLSTQAHIGRIPRALDTHEDVGFLCLTPERLVFFGDALRIRIAREMIARVGYWQHPQLFGHSAQWIRVEFATVNEPCLYIQSREKNALSHRVVYHPRLLERIRHWLEDR